MTDEHESSAAGGDADTSGNVGGTDPHTGDAVGADRDRVRIAKTNEEREDAYGIRHRVFVDEQGVPEDLERDRYDAAATHFVAYRGARPVGTARLRHLDEGRAKVERVAVLPDARGEGWGRRLMDAVEETASERGATRLVLHAQTPVEPFYERLGYRTVSDEFFEADIAHVEMVKGLVSSDST
ncbi:MAG: GNAT family N-acetyltransferase [Halobacteriota archaeon]